jgi:hypothetical protein
MERRSYFLMLATQQSLKCLEALALERLRFGKLILPSKNQPETAEGGGDGEIVVAEKFFPYGECFALGGFGA